MFNLFFILYYTQDDFSYSHNLTTKENKTKKKHMEWCTDQNPERKYNYFIL